MNCPFCREPVTDTQEFQALEGGLRAHTKCLRRQGKPGRPFREQVSFDDRGPEAGQPLKEREIRE